MSTPLARLQAAVARWPHLYFHDYTMVVGPESPFHRPAECARRGGRCALADADLAAVVAGPSPPGEATEGDLGRPDPVARDPAPLVAACLALLAAWDEPMTDESGVRTIIAVQAIRAALADWQAPR